MYEEKIKEFNKVDMVDKDHELMLKQIGINKEKLAKTRGRGARKVTPMLDDE